MRMLLCSLIRILTDMRALTEVTLNISQCVHQESFIRSEKCISQSINDILMIRQSNVRNISLLWSNMSEDLVKALPNMEFW